MNGARSVVGLELRLPDRSHPKYIKTDVSLLEARQAYGDLARSDLRSACLQARLPRGIPERS